MAEIICTAPHSPRPGGITGALRAWWRRSRREAEIRAAIRALRHFDDHLLADIGLPREDITARVRGRSGDEAPWGATAPGISGRASR